jgi:hypothetical protein
MVALSPWGAEAGKYTVSFTYTSLLQAPPRRAGGARVSGYYQPRPFVANILCEVLKAHKSQLGRYYNVSIIVLMEIILFGIALVAFVVALIAMLLGR